MGKKLMSNKLKLVEEVISFSLSEKQKAFYAKAVEQAKTFLLEKRDWRYEIAKLAIDLHEECFGKDSRWNFEEARILRSMFARELGLHLRTIEQWMDVKRLILDELPEVQTRHPFSVLYEAAQLIKSKGLKPKIAIDKYLGRRRDPAVHRLDLINRYSLNLLSSVRRFRFKKEFDGEINEIIERLVECLEKLRS